MSNLSNLGLYFKAAIFFSVLSFSAQPYAALIVQDNAQWGAGSITLDSETGLQWLDINLSVDYSYNQIQSALGIGGQYQGFRYATQNEVETLLANSGLPMGTQSSGGVSTALDFINMLGASEISRGNAEIFGITGTSMNNGMGSAAVDHTYVNGSPSYVAGVNGPTYGLDYSNDSVGSFLVVSTTQVPLPPAGFLFIAALTSFFLAGRRKH